MKTMYRAYAAYKPRIETVGVTSETDKTITTTAGRRCNKVSNNEAYFDTPEQAYKFLSDWASKEVLAAEIAMRLAQDKVEQVAKLAPSK